MRCVWSCLCVCALFIMVLFPFVSTVVKAFSMDATGKEETIIIEPQVPERLDA